MAAQAIVTATFDARNLAALRRQRGLKQRELAERLGVTNIDICRLERFLTPGSLLDQVVAELTSEPEQTPQAA